MKKKVLIMAAAGLALWQGIAFGETMPEFVMPDVVIYASSPNAADTTVDVRKVSVGAAKTVPELLRTTAGIQVQARPNSGGNEDLTVKLRGHDSRHYTVLMDGVPQSMSGVMGGSYVNWNAIPLGMVEKIEIIKGAKSAAYGQTEGGVINIITKRQDAAGGQVQAMAGTHGRRQYTFNYGAQGKKAGFSVYAAKEKRNAWLRNSRYDNEQTGISLHYDLNGTDRLKFSFDHQQLERGLVIANVPGTAGYKPRYPVTPVGDAFASSSGTPSDGSYTKLYRNNFNVGWESRREGGNDTLTWWRNHEKQREVSRNNTLLFDRYNITDRSSGLQYQGTRRLNARHTLGFGADYKRLRYGYGWYNANNNGSSRLYPSQKLDVWGAYVEDRWVMSPRWRATVGLRYDSMKGDKDAHAAGNLTGKMKSHSLSPKLNVVWENDGKTTSALSVNRIWRAPSMAEFYWHYAGGAPYMKPMNFSSGWNLEPEKGWGYEISVKRAVSKKLETKLTGFYQDIRDYINFVHTRPFNCYNIDRAKLWGFELENTWKFDEASSVFLNYTNLHTRKKGVNGKDRVGLSGELDYRPRHTLALGYRYDRNKWHARYDMTYTGSQKATRFFPATNPADADTVTVGGYVVHNLSVSYDVTKNVSMNLSLYNLFGKEYCEIYGYPMEGRVFTASVTAAF